MKKAITLIVALSWLIAYGQTPIESAEYFIDDDPGTGNGTSIDISDGIIAEGYFAISIDDLSPGMHTIHVRTKSSEGDWGLYCEKKFFVRAAVEPEIIESEYVIGDDPGVGNGTSFSIQSGLEIDENQQLTENNLDHGIHMVKVRHKNASGIWGLYSSQPLFATTLDPPHSLIEAEAFFDLDPGIGMGVPVSISNVEDLDEVVGVNIPDTLSEGDHIVYLRVRHDGENWSLYSSHDFVVDNTVEIEEHPLQFEIFPNPVGETIMINLNHAPTLTYSILNGTGQLVKAGRLDQTTIDVSMLSRGSYLLRLMGEDQAFSRKFIKM